VLRIIDAFMNEGDKILYSVAAGFLHMIQALLLKTTTKAEALMIIQQYSSNCFDCDILMKVRNYSNPFLRYFSDASKHL
jgi:hypothetical protein